MKLLHSKTGTNNPHSHNLTAIDDDDGEFTLKKKVNSRSNFSIESMQSAAYLATFPSIPTQIYYFYKIKLLYSSSNLQLRLEKKPQPNRAKSNHYNQLYKMYIQNYKLKTKTLKNSQLNYHSSTNLHQQQIKEK